jgi:hypothetical protein
MDNKQDFFFKKNKEAEPGRRIVMPSAGAEMFH